MKLLNSLFCSAALIGVPLAPTAALADSCGPQSCEYPSPTIKAIIDHFGATIESNLEGSVTVAAIDDATGLAAINGLRAGDKIVSANATPVHSAREFLQVVVIAQAFYSGAVNLTVEGTNGFVYRTLIF